MTGKGIGVEALYASRFWVQSLGRCSTQELTQKVSGFSSSALWTEFGPEDALLRSEVCLVSDDEFNI